MYAFSILVLHEDIDFPYRNGLNIQLLELLSQLHQYLFDKSFQYLKYLSLHKFVFALDHDN